ncbi:MAG TPA: AbrB/MazE/SpoVT family DNA-binding domain-containing protein [Candidatus Diapherotrites archaeon]|uniref:AbrB/MazE/SpoVT family DNA-binding domain-containing protein n=1 Tax=Candidatus Iainarchaeum sp. TaxID=3101447 RepID=A0A7J4IVD2_9ARCH|nr:AbrB/MazE/SpoVT family DNA-binding domain-containing protein [Candidatus Diapherotrites archaeon]
MTEIGIVTVSERGQIVLPKKTRQRLGVEKGTKLIVFENDGSITLTKAENLIKPKGLSEGMETFAASLPTLAKDWNYKGDDAWDDL